METTEKMRRLSKQWDAKTFAIFAIVAGVVFIGVNFFEQYLSQIAYIIFALEIVFIVLVMWGVAMHAVLKSLFAVGAGLSLLIFLAQSYCDVPSTARMADDALKSLLAFGFAYIGIEFCLFLYKEAKNRSLEFKRANNDKSPWMVIVAFAAFTGLIVWQVVQVLVPIVGHLCVYNLW